ncbi:MAG: ATP-grasp domain-containing protein [Thermoproteota archaeon]
MNLFVYEHISSGGFAGEPIPTSILSEGFAMLRTLIEDLKAAGHSVTALLDLRLKPLASLLRAEQIILVKSKEELRGAIVKALEGLDAAYIIAPEDALPSLIEIVEDKGVMSLNCTSEAIKAVSNKAKAYLELRRAGLNVPETIEVNIDESPAKIGQMARSLGFPVVFKPLSGASCAGLSIVKALNQVSSAIRKVRNEAGGERFLIQKFIRGVNASVSLIATDKKATPITLNMQRIRLSPPSLESLYEGGMVPLEHPLKNEAFKAAEEAVSIFNGLRGYVGVDIILAGDRAYVMEVNPRLTTSYVGLRRVVGFNPAQSIINAVFCGESPSICEVRGFSAFQKVKIQNLRRKSSIDVYGMENVLTPPIELGGFTYAFIEAYGSTPHSALNKLYRVRKGLMQRIYGEGSSGEDFRA